MSNHCVSQQHSWERVSQNRCPQETQNPVVGWECLGHEAILGERQIPFVCWVGRELAWVTGVVSQAVAELSVLCKTVDCVYYTASFSPRWWAVVESKETSLDSSAAHKILLAWVVWAVAIKRWHPGSGGCSLAMSALFLPSLHLNVEGWLGICGRVCLKEVLNCTSIWFQIFISIATFMILTHFP